MIYLILDAYIAATKTKMKYLKFFILAIIFLALMGACSILAYVFTPWWIIGTIVFTVMLFVLLWVHNKKLMDNAKSRFACYNIEVDKLKEILQSFSFSDSSKDNEEKNSWYSADRIKYLIEMCDKASYNMSFKSDKVLMGFKTSFSAILGFASGSILKETNLSINLYIIGVALVVVFCIYALIKLGELINSLFFKNSSSENVAELHSVLMDLLVRDFPESAQLEFKEMIKVE